MREHEIHKLDHELTRLQARPGYVLQRRRLRQLLQVLTKHLLEASISKWTSRMALRTADVEGLQSHLRTRVKARRPADLDCHLKLSSQCLIHSNALHNFQPCHVCAQIDGKTPSSAFVDPDCSWTWCLE